ncbi:hypothetical protein [Acinetobacter towneri]|uniref:hypothetical protein n=1 Tax=Acinetobacter towneri TaxID=202956 RepID=UPI0020979BF5|nr:hypothetical protein [Acinetobacter towneri]MCO8047281.1 hypothetical protein [Acinetobacter towneri]
MFIVAQTVQAETVETQVAVQDHVLIYDGPLSPEANARAAELLKQSDKIDTLKINSRGGEIGLGIDLGNLVYDHQLNVEVGQYCFSSCANYVFPAGKVKYLNLRSQLGWHGGSLQKMQFESAEMEQMYNDYIGPIHAKETAFFQKIKVQQSSTIAGQAPEYEKYQDCVSWRYTSKKMRSFGIDQVRFKQVLWLPKSSFENKCIFTIR